IGYLYGTISYFVDSKVIPITSIIRQELLECAADPLAPDIAIVQQAILILPIIEDSCPDDVTAENAAQRAIALAQGIIERHTASLPPLLNDPFDEPNEDISFNPLSAYPNPPDEMAFYGLAGDIARAIEPHTEADNMALLMQFLICFGNVIGRGPHFKAEADYHALNLFGCLVGSSAKGRKGTSFSRIRAIFSTLSPDWEAARILTGLSSGEGLIWSVRDPIEKKQPVKQKGRIVDYETVIDDHGIEDKRLLVFESEFAAVLRILAREGNTLSALMRQSWDTGNLETLTKNSPAKASGAHISITGHITKEELLRYLNSTETGNGFANRFLWICVRRSKYLPEGGDIGEVDFAPLLSRLIRALDHAHNVGEMRRDEEARKLWHEIYPELSEGKPGLLGSVTARAEAQVMRLACIYALLDCSAKIRLEHLRAALAFWDYALASAQFIFGDALGDDIADEILRQLHSCYPKGLTASQISSLFSKNVSAERLQTALSALLQLNLIRHEKQKQEAGKQGRPIEMWFAVSTLK
ncbi:MAG TPA: DUF3987 domain-containing protein, partial [Abditibacteriaceae bacterium]